MWINFFEWIFPHSLNWRQDTFLNSPVYDGQTIVEPCSDKVTWSESLFRQFPHRIEQLPAEVSLLQGHMLSFIWGCVSCLPRRNALLWRTTPLIFCAGGQRSVWYLPEVLCQSAINRFRGHPTPLAAPPCGTPTDLWPTTGHTSPLLCLVKMQRAVSHDSVLRCKANSPSNPHWETARVLIAQRHPVAALPLEHKRKCCASHQT